jgi:hypothetical protein
MVYNESVSHCHWWFLSKHTHPGFIKNWLTEWHPASSFRLPMLLNIIGKYPHRRNNMEVQALSFISVMVLNFLCFQPINRYSRMEYRLPEIKIFQKNLKILYSNGPSTYLSSPDMHLTNAKKTSSLLVPCQFVVTKTPTLQVKYPGQRTRRPSSAIWWGFGELLRLSSSLSPDRGWPDKKSASSHIIGTCK